MLSKLSFSPPRYLLDALLLLAAAAYILAGVPLVTFHGDEGMQVYATRDFLTAVVDRDPLALATAPPYFIDSPGYLRLINGSVQRHAAGAVLYLRGHNTGDLPIQPGWNWGLPYPENVAGGWLPKNSVLFAARYTSAVFLVLGLIPVFGMGMMLGGRFAAYLAVVLVALNPLLLLNARRAMMEGSMLGFGLWVLWLALVIARRIYQGGAVPWWLWGGLTLVAGLALASKHSAVLFLIPAWGWLLVSIVWARRAVVRRVGLLAVAGALAISLFIGLSPALWNNPPARLLDLARLRANLIAIQTDIEAGAPMPLAQRATWLFTKPYGAPPAHYDRPDWGEVPAIREAEQNYQASGLAGLPSNPFIGAVVMALALAGCVALLRGEQARWGGMLLLWLGVVVVVLLGNPLPWDRYYLPLVPVVALLAALGGASVLRWICEQTRTETTLQSTAN